MTSALIADAISATPVSALLPIEAATSRSILLGPVRPDLIRDESLADLLEATAARVPEQVALIQGDRQLSYAELNERAGRVASRLIETGVGPGQIVGLWLPRGIELLVMQAAIAKAGAAWLPFDADTPVERIAVCLEDAGAAGILGSEQFADRLDPLACPVWMAEHLSRPASAPLRRRAPVAPADPAYVIYTSGSTGKPKGIAISQGAICHFLRSENSLLGVHGEDVVYQGFSVAFDMSFEEIWISYLVGATLWIAPREIAADPEALPRALAEHHVTVLHAVPTLVALFEQDIPSLRLLNMGGEMCPEALVARWTRPGRRVFNSYGPTEATVSASMTELRAGEPVTIGAPLPNYGLMVIDPAAGRIEPLAHGEVGELCITGPGVATGYLGRPELTAAKFLDNPWAAGRHHARLYRTGDLARIDADGRVHCLWRTDDQVKIRGFRVELGEIEAAIARQPGVGTAAVVLRREDGIEQLVAFVVPEGEAGIDHAGLRGALTACLPPYMVPGHYETLSDMPRLISGKIDRNELKKRPLAQAVATGSDKPCGAAEEALFAALGGLFPGQAIRRDADFFSDLGGHSLYAARLASALRRHPDFGHVTVRDIYQHRVVGAIAAAIAAAPQAADDAPMEERFSPSRLKRWTCGLAQAAALPGLIAIRMLQWLAPFFAYHFYTGDSADSIPFAIGVSVGVFVLSTLLEFAVAVAGKWLIAGRMKPGRYPLWGLTYYRWWLADRLVESAPTYLIHGSSLYAWWLRSLGARIGRDVAIGSMTLRAPDLLTVADGASIGNGVNFENARVENGWLRLGTISLGSEAHVGSCCVLEGGTAVETCGHLEGQSALGEGQRVPPARIWSGSPARDAGAFDLESRPPRPAVSRARLAGETLFFAVGSLALATLFFLPVFPGFMLIDALADSERFAWLQGAGLPTQLGVYFLLALPANALLVLCTALLSGLIRRAVLPRRISPGSWPLHSNLYCRKWLVAQLQEVSLNVLHGVYATVYAPFWYRLLGAKVGRGAEISTAVGIVPDMLTLGDDSFIADAVMLGDEQIDGGWIRMQPTVIARRSFVGNGAYVPDGTALPENLLIGVHTRAPDNARMREGDTWLGSPPIHLPAREEIGGFPESLTFRPSPLRRLCRGLVEALRIIAPHAIVTAVGYAVVLHVMPVAGAGRWAEALRYLVCAGLLYGVGTFLFVALLKWLLLGRYRPCNKPMWTPFVWISEAITNLYEGITVPNFMRYLRGTPLLPPAFRLFGCRIGSGVYMDTTDITEFDCVRIGDHSELNALACPQTHLFEDRVMKIDHVEIGRGVYLGPRSCVLFGASVGDRARLGALTLVMKGEFIPAGSRWAGCPASPARS
jgi:non-ribosomal peptide synthetase-like protein